MAPDTSLTTLNMECIRLHFLHVVKLLQSESKKVPKIIIKMGKCLHSYILIYVDVTIQINKRYIKSV